MCGIAGFSNPEYDYTKEETKWTHLLKKMNLVQQHRGPDEEGTYLSKGCGLGHVRLSIIDLLTGKQPMIQTVAENTYAIVFNGEIYNMHELKRNLEREGYAFQTNSDTEVCLAGYILHGTDFIKEVNGIFAISIWDSQLNTLFLFRDRFGVKPLFYTFQDGTLIFSSQIKALFQYPGITPVIGHDGLCEILGLGPAKTPGNGVFEDIEEVLPGHYVVYNQSGFETICYWQLKSVPHEDSYARTVERTSDLLYDAITKQMLSDIPISTFLSGGLDSSIVTAICAAELQKQGKALTTFSFDFQNNHLHFKSNAFQPSEDRPWVDKMVSHSHTHHIYLECDNTILVDYLQKAVDARDLPCMADVESSLLYFCSKVVDFNKVTLTGECADEIFGGYPWFHKQEMFDSPTFPWSMDLARRKVLLSDDLISGLRLEEYVQNAYETTIQQTPRLAGEEPIEARRRELAYLNIRWFMQTLLDRMDRTSMYSGLEARVPFADHRLVEYVWNVPWEMKCPDGLVKGLLRKASEPWLPHDIVYRKKSPYPKTYDPGYEQLLATRLSDVLSQPNAPIRQLIDKRKLEQFLASPSDYGKPWYGQLMAGPQMLAYMLQINYWLEAYHIQLL